MGAHIGLEVVRIGLEVVHTGLEEVGRNDLEEVDRNDLEEAARNDLEEAVDKAERKVEQEPHMVVLDQDQHLLQDFRSEQGVEEHHIEVADIVGEGPVAADIAVVD